MFKKLARLPSALRRSFLIFLVARSRKNKAASWLASLYKSGYKSQATLAKLHKQGYVSPKVSISHDDIRYGDYVYLGDRVTLYRTGTGGHIEFADYVKLYSDIVMETTDGGVIRVGERTHIQPRCHFVAGKSSIIIGRRCEIAPACAFYPFNHGIEAGMPVMDQPLISRGDIEIGDDVWLGYGVVVLDGVKIGNGAVVGANSVVTKNIPENAVAVGSPAKVIRLR